MSIFNDSPPACARRAWSVASAHLRLVSQMPQRKKTTNWYERIIAVCNLEGRSNNDTYKHTHTHTHTQIHSHTVVTNQIPFACKVRHSFLRLNVAYSFYSFYSFLQADRIDGQITQTKAELSRLLDILCLTAEEVMEEKEDVAGFWSGRELRVIVWLVTHYTTVTHP